MRWGLLDGAHFKQPYRHTGFSGLPCRFHSCKTSADYVDFVHLVFVLFLVLCSLCFVLCALSFVLWFFQSCIARLSVSEEQRTKHQVQSSKLIPSGLFRRV